MKRRKPGRAEVLLSAGNLSGAQREEVLAQVLSGVRASERPRWVPRLAWAGVPALLAAAALLVFWVRAVPDDGGLRARGGGAMPVLRVDCEPGGLDACRLGGTLMFAVEGAPPSARLAAFAEPAAGGERIWYFSGDGESPAIGDQTPDAILRRGIRLGPEHQPGVYLVTVVVTATPQLRPALLELAGGGPGALAVRRWAVSVIP